MEKSILFVGNSYTYYNDMPEKFFAEKAAACGHPFQVTAVTKGGWKLSEFADPEDTEGQRLRAVIEGQHYDYVVLQEQSITPVVDRELFFRGIAGVQALLADKGEHFVLYATWGREPGSEMLEELGMTNEEMTAKLAEAYDQAGEKFGMKVAHVGKAFAACRAENPEAELYNPDKSHPSAQGSELAAETILAAILG